MKSNFQINGLDCVNCAAELERRIGKIPGVKEANINFMMQRMELLYEENKEEIIKKVKKVIQKEEPDVQIEEI